MGVLWGFCGTDDGVPKNQKKKVCASGFVQRRVFWANGERPVEMLTMPPRSWTGATQAWPPARAPPARAGSQRPAAQRERMGERGGWRGGAGWGARGGARRRGRESEHEHESESERANQKKELASPKYKIFSQMTSHRANRANRAIIPTAKSGSFDRPHLQLLDECARWMDAIYGWVRRGWMVGSRIDES